MSEDLHRIMRELHDEHCGCQPHLGLASNCSKYFLIMRAVAARRELGAAEEREACAKLAEAYVRERGEIIAAAIRARGKDSK